MKIWKIEVEEHDNGEMFIRMYDGMVITAMHLYQQDAILLRAQLEKILVEVMGEPEC